LTKSVYSTSGEIPKLGSLAVEFTKAFYSPREVAEMASLHPSTILNYIASGRLYAVKLSERTYRIPVKAVVQLLEPERLPGSSMTVEPTVDVEDEILEPDALIHA
jgi:excisionase family DNA binding protein